MFIKEKFFNSVKRSQNKKSKHTNLLIYKTLKNKNDIFLYPMKKDHDFRFISEEEYARMSPASFDPLAIYENDNFAQNIILSGIREDYLKEFREKTAKETDKEKKKLLEEECKYFEKRLEQLNKYERENRKFAKECVYDDYNY